MLHTVITKSGLRVGYTVVVKHGPRHFGTWDGTVWHLEQDSSALRSELSLGHFGTSADLSGQFRPTRLVPKCPGSEVSVIHHNICLSTHTHKKTSIYKWF